MNSATPGRRAMSGRWQSIVWLLATLAVAVAAVIASAAFSGAAAEREALDPGAFVRWALPIALTVHHLVLGVVVGCLIFAATLVPSKDTDTAEEDSAAHPAFTLVRTVAVAASFVWLGSVVVVTVLTYANLVGQPVSGSAAFLSQLTYFLTDLIVGQAWAAITVIAFLVCNLAFFFRSTTGLACTALLALTAIVPISLIGHAAGSDDHYAGVGALAVHWLGVLVWVGGVAALAVTIPVLASTSTTLVTKSVIARFSALAGVAFFLVLGSGVINAALRLGEWDGLLSRYGQLIVIKFSATLLLGAIGFAHRRWAMTQVGSRSGTLLAWRLVIGEVLIMGGVIGVTAALGRTAPPVPLELEPAITPAEVFTGYPMPPALTWYRWLSEWRWDWLWLAFILTAAAVYLLGVRKTRITGDKWPRKRTASWFTGIVLLVYVTCGAPTIYGMVLISAHTVMLLALAVLIPLLLAVGAPLDLLRLSVPRRTDGSRGPREWIEASTPSVGAVVRNPLFSGAVLVLSLILLYYTPLLRLSLDFWIAHQVTNLYFLIIGFWFMASVMRTRIKPRTRLRQILAVAGVAGILLLWANMLAFGVSPVLEVDWFSSLDRTWGPSIAVDQQNAGTAVLLIGVAPLAVVLATFLPYKSRLPSTRPTDTSRSLPDVSH
ncbi:cytochrome c oxidase assembly protein [Brevibacterium aurantiacum]|uniref:cytochrome c oxidase assembly protein n=1 Tax=Brevibacterium aurantiacum TaxID=273384 RepID=UPI0002F58528|nr:cytochrome c oxidase assembly protein [Brevibacterium aurantiacum]